MTIDEMAIRVQRDITKAQAELEFYESCARVRVLLLANLNQDLSVLGDAQAIEERFAREDDDGGPLYPPEVPEARI